MNLQSMATTGSLGDSADSGLHSIKENSSEQVNLLDVNNRVFSSHTLLHYTILDSEPQSNSSSFPAGMARDL